MQVLLHRWLRLIAALLLTVIIAAPASALDPRYKDEDGDLLADIPTDPSELVDPPTLIFAYTPVEDPAVYAKVWDGFLKHMEKVTGKKVQFFPVQSNAAQIEAMRAGRLHIAGFNTGSNPLAVACAGFRPFAIMASADGSYGYEMEIITYPGSGIEKVEDIRAEVGLYRRDLELGVQGTSALLKSEFGMEAGRDYRRCSRVHDNSVLGVANKIIRRAVANSVMQRMIERGVVKAEQIKSIYKSQTFPTTGYGVVYNLKPELQEKIKEAFFSFPWEGSELQKEFAKSGEAKFIEISHKVHWDVVRKIDAAMGVQYTCK